MSISASQDPGHHRRIIINTTASELLNDSEYKDSPLSGSGGLHRQSSVDNVTEYRKKYDLEYTEEQNGLYKVNLWAQSKALFQKNFALQSKQKGTNLCQVKKYCYYHIERLDFDSPQLFGDHFDFQTSRQTRAQ